MDWRPVLVAACSRAPALASDARAHQDGVQYARSDAPPEGTALFNLSRLYGSTIGIALSRLLLRQHPGHAPGARQEPHALPRRRSCHGFDRRAGACQAQRYDHRSGGFHGIIDQFKVMMIAMLVVSPLVLFLRKLRRPTDVSVHLSPSGSILCRPHRRHRAPSGARRPRPLRSDQAVELGEAEQRHIGRLAGAVTLKPARAASTRAAARPVIEDRWRAHSHRCSSAAERMGCATVAMLAMTACAACAASRISASLSSASERRCRRPLRHRLAPAPWRPRNRRSGGRRCGDDQRLGLCRLRSDFDLFDMSRTGTTRLNGVWPHFFGNS